MARVRSRHRQGRRRVLNLVDGLGAAYWISSSPLLATTALRFSTVGCRILGFREFLVGPLRLLVEATVLQGHRRLGGERRDELEILRGEPSLPARPNAQDAQDLRAQLEGHPKERPVAPAPVRFPVPASAEDRRRDSTKGSPVAATIPVRLSPILSRGVDKASRASSYAPASTRPSPSRTRMPTSPNRGASCVNRVGASLLRAVGAAEDLPPRVHSMADDPTAAVLAGRSHRVDRALEAIVRASDALEADFHRIFVIVAAHVTAFHGFPLLVRRFALGHSLGGSCYRFGGAALMSARAD